MRAEYDSEADVLSIDLIQAQRWNGSDAVDDDFCTVATVDDRPANVELLSPAQHLNLLTVAAQRHGLDAEALEEPKEEEERSKWPGSEPEPTRATSPLPGSGVSI